MSVSRLSLAGGAVALLITFWTAGTLMKFLPLMTDEPVYLNVSPDRIVLLVTLITSVVTAMIFGILPALRSSKLAPVSVLVIVSEAFVNRYWPNQEAIGKKLFSDLPKEWLTVVGVARDIKVNGLNENPTPFVYIPLYQFYDSELTVAVRTSGDPLAYRKSIEEKIHSLNSDVNVSDVTTLEFREQIATIGQRIAGTFVGVFGLLALVLATVGIYGVTAYTTRQRTHEIGLRMAFGATRQDVLRLVLGHAMKLTALGVGLGLALAFVMTRFLSSLLLGVTSTDALTFVSVAILLCAVTILACFLPARRAMRIDPMEALRYE